jgi:hypothetical protein
MNAEQTPNSIEHAVGEHRYIFTWAPEQEPKLVTALQTLVDNPNLDFSWCDAAQVLFQLNTRNYNSASSVQSSERFSQD